MTGEKITTSICVYVGFWLCSPFSIADIFAITEGQRLFPIKKIRKQTRRSKPIFTTVKRARISHFYQLSPLIHVIEGDTIRLFGLYFVEIMSCSIDYDKSIFLSRVLFNILNRKWAFYLYTNHSKNLWWLSTTIFKTPGQRLYTVKKSSRVKKVLSTQKWQCVYINKQLLLTNG